MTRFSKMFVVAFALLALASVAANAQHLISNKAGFVNRVEGKVFILRADSEDGAKGRASLGTQMRDGDRVMTEANSFAELLLSPGSYVRLNENSEVRAVNTSLSQIRFEVVKGSAMVEVATVGEEVSSVNKHSPLEIVTPHGAVSIAKDGLYRFDHVETNTLVQVRQGELFIGDRNQFIAGKATKIGKGKAVKLTGDTIISNSDIAKVNKDVSDRFDSWSFNRANTLMAANVSALRRSRTMTALNYGWIYDSFYNCYTFIPRNGLWYSPYGFGFFNSYGNCLYYWPYGYSPYYGNPYGNSGGGGGVTLPSRVIAGNDRAPIQREIEGRRIDNNPSFGDRGFGNADVGSRSISTASSAPATTTIATSAPARTEAPAASSSSSGHAAPPTRP